MPKHLCRRLLLTLLLAPALTFASPAGAAIPPDPVQPKTFGTLDVRSSSVIVLDAADSWVLYSKQAQLPVPIASITKLMTALVVLDAGQPLDGLLQRPA